MNVRAHAWRGRAFDVSFRSGRGQFKGRGGPWPPPQAAKVAPGLYREMNPDPRLGPQLSEHEIEEALHAGATLFDEGDFWEAHEAWESGWHRAPEEDRDFFQGLIHMAAACLHHRDRNLHGFEQQMEKMRLRLGRYPDVHRGVPLTDVRAAMARLPHPGTDCIYPKLDLVRAR